ATAPGDFSTLTGNVTIAAGQQFADINICVVDDQLVEGTENVNLTLTGITSGNNGISVGSPATASLAISDNDTSQVSISKVQDGQEGVQDGKFRFTMTKASSKDTTISYSIGGVATNGVDYGTLSGVMVVAAGQLSADLTLAVTDDSNVEPTESVS